MSGITFRRAMTPLTGERAFAWALGAPYHVAHGTPVDGPEERGTVNARAERPKCREMLSRDWGVNRREDLVARMTSLGNEGHRRLNRERVARYAMMWRPAVAAAREECLAAIRDAGGATGGEGAEEAGRAAADLWLLDAVQADRRGIRGSPLLAFDAARAVMLARDGLFLGWLREEDAFDYLLDVARHARRTYRSWEEYGADYLLSRDVWAGEDTADLYDATVRALLTRSDSPWRTIPWQVPGPWGGGPRPLREVRPDAPAWTLERG